MEKQQTAVEWLFLMMNNPNKDQEFANKLYDKAKQMEKQQIKDSWFDSTKQFDNAAEMTYKKEFE